MKRGWNILFLNYIKIKQTILVSYNFKAALDYSLLYIDQYSFNVMILLWKNIFNTKVESNLEQANRL